MNRSTIDFGIDLGTTNSAIAVLDGVAQRIIKNNEDQDTTPSAVLIDKNKQVHVGQRAKNATLKKPNDAYVEFKRRMGTEFVYHFKASSERRKPEELSAEVLKSLRADVSRKLGEEMSSAVVTVPAAFELHQCDATKKAAELAGFQLCALLQEPVAAALAHGFQADSERAYWLVYDFGGGTFDAALIKAQDGLINVVHHGGNNFLGGSDIDWAILEKVIAPLLAKEFNLPEFSRANARWENEIRLLKHAIEKAKVELTTKEQTTLDVQFEDDSGKEVDGEEISLTKAQIIGIAEPIINQSADICLKVLSEKRLGPAEVQKVIVVGGPTKAPYFRDILSSRLGIQLDFSVDPLTVVAQGAAVFAGTQRVEAKHKSPAKSGEFNVELKYSPVGSETDPQIIGKVSGGSDEAIEGFVVEFVNEASKWRSGRIPLKKDGVFMANVIAEKGVRNTFVIELFDSQGAKQKTFPDRFVYTVGAVVEEQPLIHSMGVELAGNEYEVLAQKGAGLPIKTKIFTLHSIKAVKAGDPGVALRIPILEGDNEDAADRNKLIGSFNITGEMVKRDIPVGADIEISLKIDASRLLKVFLYIPVIDEEFEKSFDLRKKDIDADSVASDWKSQRDRLKALARKASDAQAGDALTALEKLETSTLFSEISDCVKIAKNDPDAASKAESLLLEFKQKLDAVENDVELPALRTEFDDWHEDTRKITDQHGSTSQQDRAEDLRNRADEAIKEHNGDRLKTLVRQVQQLYFEVLMALPQFWVNQFQQLSKRKGEMSDASKADRLFDMGQRYLTENNADGLRNVVNQLYDLLPKAAAEAVKRGYGSDVVR
jgi:molecular chaperone DnaK